MKSGGLRLVAAVLPAAVLATACGAGGAQPSAGLPRNPAALAEGKPYRPPIDPGDFVSVIDNPYLPLRPGTTLVYQGTSEGQREKIVVHVTDRTREIMGITATVVRDRAFVDGALVEDTFDWFAQDRAGNVWYLGEATKEYDGGKVVSTAGSWEAGVGGAQPGIVMLGAPRLGDRYRQEYYRGEAEDMAQVMQRDASVNGPEGSFDHVLVTEDWTPLEPKVRENKFYARGVGVVLERRTKGGSEVLRLVEFRSPGAG
jgi:hypothetical protein